MAASNFRPSLALVLAHEGGYVNHPRDPGGATNRGVTQAVYDAYRKYHGQKQRSVKYILDSEVSEIYNKNYWRLVRGDSLPCGLDYAVFDFAVNSGVSRATRYLQRLVGVADDGVIGVITLNAVEAANKADPVGLISKYCANRLAFVRSLSTFDVFGKGWTRRIVGTFPGQQDTDTGVIDYAVKMAKTVPIITYPKAIPDVATGKATSVIVPEAFPTLEGVYSPEALKLLATANDEYAKIIAEGSV